MSRARNRIRAEHGFTLIELLVTSTLAIVVLFAILGASEIFSRSASVTDKTAAAQDAARATVRSMVQTLREARQICLVATSPCPSASVTTPIGGTPTRSDLVVATYITTGDSEVAGWVRYCATADATPSLLMGTREGDAYAAPGACAASDTTNAWRYTTVLKGTLQDTAKLFDYTTNACVTSPCSTPTVADIQSVGIRVAVGTSPGAAATYNSVVRDAVSFRNRSST
jgi:type II secretory pathway pseudopilin PulG